MDRLGKTRKSAIHLIYKNGFYVKNCDCKTMAENQKPKHSSACHKIFCENNIYIICYEFSMYILY